MTTFYVATRARYTLIEADNEAAAREHGYQALHALYADVRESLGREVPIEICTIRLATDDEIKLQQFHEEMTAREKAKST